MESKVKIIIFVILSIVIVSFFSVVWYISASTHSSYFVSKFNMAQITHMDISSKSYAVSVVYDDGDTEILYVKESDYSANSVGDVVRVKRIDGYNMFGKFVSHRSVINNGDSVSSDYETSFILHFIEILFCGLVIVCVVGFLVLLVCCLP